jgi:hypothetical protein
MMHEHKAGSFSFVSSFIAIFSVRGFFFGTIDALNAIPSATTKEVNMKNSCFRAFNLLIFFDPYKSDPQKNQRAYVKKPYAPRNHPRSIFTNILL